MYYSGFTAGILESNGNTAIPPVVDFIFGINTENSGSSNDTFVLPLTNGTAYDFIVDWGDGTTNTVNTSTLSDISHQYLVPGEYEVSLAGTAPEVIFGGTIDALKVTAIKDWGQDAWENVENMFNGCSNLAAYSAADAPVFAPSVTSLAGMFSGCSQLSVYADNWDVSGIDDLSGMFQGCLLFNGNLSQWDVSSVTDFSHLFDGCVAFDGSVSGWITDSAIDISYMFNGVTLFNDSINSWNVSNVINMGYLLKDTNFGGSLSTWDTSNVTNMDYMFSGVPSTTYDHGIDAWDVTSLLSAVGFMENKDMAINIYNDILNSWGVQTVQNDVVISFGTSKYDGASLLRKDNLVLPQNHNWTITDGGIEMMTLIAGNVEAPNIPIGSESETGYMASNGNGTMDPRRFYFNGVPRYITGMTYNPDRTVFIPDRTHVLSVYSTETSSSFWDKIRIIPDANNTPSQSTWEVSGYYTTNTTTIGGQTWGMTRSEGSQKFWPGQTYYIIFIK